MAQVILIVDDQEDIRRSLQGILEDEGYQVLMADNGADAIALAREELPDLVLLDIWMPGLDGIQTLERLKNLLPDLTVVMMSGHGTIETAVKATKLGAFDFIEKPFSLDKMLITIANALSFKELRTENEALRRSTHQECELVGVSQAVEQLRDQVCRVSLASTPVLICGEPGVGKEVVARSIHQHSPRRTKPFITINCSAIPGELLEAELFGHEKGAGGTSRHKGKVELADEGTIFLDDIHELPLRVQGMLVQMLREHCFERPGGNRMVRLNVRVIAATVVPLGDWVTMGRFNRELFQMLNVVTLFVPPLRERREDIPHLVRHFIHLFHRHEGWELRQFDEGAMAFLQRYPWPGNGRELKNLVERILIMSSGMVVTADDLTRFISPAEAGAAEKTVAGSDQNSFEKAREQFERQFLLDHLQAHGWDIDATARAVDLERTRLQRKLVQYHLTPEASC